jgi:hypothetical protein
VKKDLLIIQLDGAYFLYETLLVLEKASLSLKDFNITVLASNKAIDQIKSKTQPLIKGLTSDIDGILEKIFDLSFNLSMDEYSWPLHHRIKATHKVGPFQIDENLSVPDLWSSFLLTIKAGSPFLTFHLQDIYRNILGIKSLPTLRLAGGHFREIITGNFSANFAEAKEVELLINSLKANFPHIVIRKSEEIDLISDLTHSLYIGPATTHAIKVCEVGARGIFIGSQFQGFNLIPYDSHHYLVSTRGDKFNHKHVAPFINSIISRNKPVTNNNYSFYESEMDSFGISWKSLSTPDENFPFYQCHLVLWNFLLNLLDINIDVTKCTLAQVDVLKANHHVLTKLLRLHDYALSSVDTIYRESKLSNTKADVIEGHLKNLLEIEEVVEQVASSHPYIRPFLDFYRIRRGQNTGSTLHEKSQNTFITYTEEHHALSALNELFSVTLRKNEASILK